MHAATRVIGDAPYALYPGDVIEGQEAAAQVAAGNAQEISEDEEIAATPAAVAHADALGVDLAQVEGTGADGQILKADVAAAADESTNQVEEN